MLAKQALFVILATSYLCNTVFAGTMEALEPSPRGMKVITVTIGPDFVNPGQQQTLTLLPPFQNHYTKSTASAAVTDIGGFVGVEQVFSKKISIQFGASGYCDSSMTVRGDVWQFASPVFDDLSYSYHIHHARVMLATKLLATITFALRPYISGEIGAAFNQASGYQEIALELGAIPTPPFSNNSRTSVAWAVGSGVDYNITRQLRLGIGYQFANLGSVALGQTTAATTKQSLSLSHLYANQLRLQLTLLV